MKNIFDSVKDNKRKVFIGISLVFSMFLIAFASYNVNKLFANLSGDETPVNTAFDDINFYKCVVDNYNSYSNNKTEDKEYTDNLSDDDLNSIERFYCNSKNVNSIKGIEKLKNITILSMTGNNITSIDLSENKLLDKVLLSRNKINFINISNNTALTTISLVYNELSSLDVSNNINLSILDLKNNNLKTLNVDNNINIKNLMISFNDISELNVDKLPLLEKLLIDNTKIVNINLNENTKLKELDISKTPMAYLDISKNLNLSTFALLDTALAQNIPAMGIGDTHTIVNNIKVPDGYNVDYSITDSSVAKIENGKIVALSPGKTTFRANFNFPRDLSVSSSVEVVKAKMTSDKYVINDDKKLVYTKGDANIDTIISNIKTNVGKIVVEDGKVKVISNSNVHLEYNLINYDSDYEIKDDYILVKDNVFDENKIRSNSDDLTFNYNKKNNIVDTVDIIYKGEVIDTLKNSSYKIKDYEIVTDGENKKYIYLKNKSFDESKIEVINCSYEIKDNKIIIKAGDNILDEIYLSSISIKDSKYGIEDSSIYTDTNDLNKDDIICINGGVEGAGDYTYKIIVAGKVVDTISVIKLDISDESKKDTINKYGYMYVGIRKATELSDFKVINGYIEETNDKLTIYTSNNKKHIIKTIKLLKISSDKYDLVGGYSKKDNGYYIYTKSIDLNSIKMSEELIIKSKNDGDYVIALKTDNTEFESLYASYIMEDSSYKLKDDNVYYGLRGNNDLTLKVKNGYAQKNNGEFDIYLNNGKKTDYMKIIALITDYVSDNNYDFKNGVLDLGDDVFNPLHITDKINANIEYSTKDNVLKILHDGKVVGQIKIKSKANIQKTITTTTSKVTNTTSSTTKVSTTTTTTTKLETRSNRITTKNVGNKNSSCSRCKMLKVFTLSLIILYILYLIYIIYTFKKEEKEKQ